jgi:hypothetical protein
VKVWNPGESDPGADSLDEVAREDWSRYGLSHRPPATDASAAPGDKPAARATMPGKGRLSRVRTSVQTRRASAAGRGAAADDLFAEYRHEAISDLRLAGSGRSPRFKTNLVTASVVGGIGAVVLIAGLVSSVVTPAPAPTPERTLAPGSALPAAGGTSRSVHIGVTIDMPLAITIADRNQTPDDGTTMYLTGPNGGFSMDPGTGAIEKMYGGYPFANGLRRAIFMGGLWVSSWQAGASGCGPSCWETASTYRVDPQTSQTTASLPGTYLVGAGSDGIWVATGGNLERLDPSSAKILATVPWKYAAEPRLGCGSLWAFVFGPKSVLLDEINPATGETIGESSLASNVTDGPTYMEGQCWMMSGSGGVSGGSTTLVWLNVDGTTMRTMDFPGRTILTLDREFWEYSGDGKLQRFEATTGYNYGVSYVLPRQPPNNDPGWLFAATGTLWMVDGQKLIGFDLPTGTGRVNG